MQDQKANVIDLCVRANGDSADKVLSRKYGHIVSIWQAAKRGEFNEPILKLLTRSVDDFSQRCEYIGKKNAAVIGRQMTATLIQILQEDSEFDQSQEKIFEQGLTDLESLLGLAGIAVASDSKDESSAADQVSSVDNVAAPHTVKTFAAITFPEQPKPSIYYLSARDAALDHCKQFLIATGFEVKTVYKIQTLLSEQLSKPASHWLVDFDGLDRDQLNELSLISQSKDTDIAPNILLVSQFALDACAQTASNLSCDYYAENILDVVTLCRIFHDLEVVLLNNQRPIALVSANATLQSKLLRAASKYNSDIRVYESAAELQQISTGQVDDPSVLILDMESLDNEAGALIKELQGRGWFERCSLVVLAAPEKEVLREQLLSLGAKDFLYTALAPSWIIKTAILHKYQLGAAELDVMVEQRMDPKVGVLSEQLFSSTINHALKRRAQLGLQDWSAYIHLSFHLDHRALTRPLSVKVNQPMVDNAQVFLGAHSQGPHALAVMIVDAIVDGMGNQDCAVVGGVDRIDIVTFRDQENELLTFLESVRTAMQSLSLRFYGHKNALRAYLGCARIAHQDLAQLQLEATEMNQRARSSGKTDYCLGELRAESLTQVTVSSTEFGSVEQSKTVDAILLAHKNIVKLRHAINTGGFSLAYQPIITKDSRHEINEVYLRVKDESNEQLNSGDMMHAAKLYKLCHFIDRWVISRALAEYANGQTCGTLFLKVTRETYEDPQFDQWLSEQFDNSLLDPSCACLQVTVGDLSQNISVVKRLFSHCKSIGLATAVEGFDGETDMISQLNSVDRYLDFLKLDAKYIDRLSWDASARRGFTDLKDHCEINTINIVAPFVESEYALNMFESMGITHMQGYYLGAPQQMGSAASLGL